MLSGGVAFAASKYVRALESETPIHVGVKLATVAPSLQVGSNRYILASSVVASLGVAGVTSVWNAKGLTIYPVAATKPPAPPTKLPSATMQTENGLTITVTGAKWVNNGTDLEVDLTASNHSKSNVTIDDFMDDTLVQGATQLQADDMNTSLQQTTFPTTMANGVVAKAVLYFTGGHHQGGTFKFSVPVTSDNYNLNWANYVFTFTAK